MIALTAPSSGGLAFALGIFLGIGAPSAGLVMSLAGMQRYGVNFKCSLSMVLFFAALLTIGITYSLSQKEAFTPSIAFGILMSATALHGLAALFSIAGLREIRTHRNRWQTARQRDRWSFWLNFAMLIVMGFYFFACCHPSLLKTMQMSPA